MLYLPKFKVLSIINKTTVKIQQVNAQVTLFLLVD